MSITNLEISYRLHASVSFSSFFRLCCPLPAQHIPSDSLVRIVISSSPQKILSSVMRLSKITIVIVAILVVGRTQLLSYVVLKG